MKVMENKEKTTPSLVWTRKNLFWQAWEGGCYRTPGLNSLTSAPAALCDDLGKDLVSTRSEPPDKTCEFSQTFECSRRLPVCHDRYKLHCAGLEFDPQKSCLEEIPLYLHSFPFPTLP